jgi:hypothetical protein
MTDDVDGAGFVAAIAWTSRTLEINVQDKNGLIKKLNCHKNANEFVIIATRGIHYFAGFTSHVVHHFSEGGKKLFKAHEMKF